MTGFAIQGVESFIFIPYGSKEKQWLEPEAIKVSPNEQFEKIEKMTKLFGPTAAICNYGFGGFEGMKARRSKVNGRQILIPTPELNYYRISKLIKFYQADENKPQELPEQYWMDALALLIKKHADVIPQSNEGEYYIRPIFAKGEQLGMKIGENTSQGIFIFGTPVKSYYPPELKAYTLTKEVRCMPGGTGGIKSTANYSKSMDGQRKAREAGYHDALFLDETLIDPTKVGIEGNIYKTEINDLLKCNIQELAVANVCVVKNGALLSPIERDTILPSTTKRHIFQIAEKLLSVKVLEKLITLEDLLTADEAFACGTAAGITPIVGVGVKDEYFKINGEMHGETMKKIKDRMLAIYWGEEDPFHWMCKIEL